MNPAQTSKWAVESALEVLYNLPEDTEARSRSLSSVARTLREELPLVNDKEFARQAGREFQKTAGESYLFW